MHVQVDSRIIYSARVLILLMRRQLLEAPSRTSVPVKIALTRKGRIGEWLNIRLASSLEWYAFVSAAAADIPPSSRLHFTKGVWR